MNIEAEKFTIEMKYSELLCTALDTKSAIERSIETHWINHQDAWRSQEQDRLNRLRSFSLALGIPHIYEQVFQFAEEQFKKANGGKL